MVVYLVGGEKGKLCYDFDVLIEVVGGYWYILIGCCKGYVC